MRKIFIFTVLAAVVLFGVVSAAEAMMGGCPHCGKGMQSDKEGSLEDKLFDKMSFIHKNAEEIGLTEEQASKVHELKIRTKKTLILKQAEIDVLALDIKTGLWHDTLDSAALSKLVAQKYDLKKEKTIAIVEAYGELKKILTKEQMDKTKSLWKDLKKQMMCGMMGGKK